MIDNHTHAQTKEEINELLFSMKENNIEKSIILHLPENDLSELIKNTEKYNNLFVIGSISILNKNFYNKFIELHEAIKNKKIFGVKLYLGYEHFYANDNRCDIIYQMCSENNIPVVFHTGDTWIGERQYSKIKYANPIFLDEIAVKYPKLKIVISHMGNPIWINETAELVYKNKNIYTDFSGMLIKNNTQRAKEYNKKTEQNILDVLNYVGDSKKILFGSDYNYFEQEIYVSFINKLYEQKKITKTEYENITYKNAERIYNI